jgi:hypothetical protein
MVADLQHREKTAPRRRSRLSFLMAVNHLRLAEAV